MQNIPVHDSVILAKGGDRHAFANLYDQFAPLIRAVAYDTTGSVQESEDLCQEIFLQAYRKLGQLQDPARFPGWLMMIARRNCSTWRRIQRRQPKLGMTTADMNGDGFCNLLDVEGGQASSPSETTDETIPQLREAVRQLPDKERTALHLFYLIEQPATSAREMMGLSSSGFYKVLERAKRRVAAILQRGKVMP
jgi:RNA polymerase sigma-70 factor, ECF subfamily